ncbi:MAG: hypothetical protein AABX83_03015 [Nanoarchaeota archaeon]
MMNKRGETSSNTKLLIFFGISFLIFVGWWYLVNSSFWGEWSKNLSIDTDVQGFDQFVGQSFSWMTYVFGGIPAWLVTNVGQNSAIIITLFAWILLFVTFGDIFNSFSTFSTPASWVIAFAIAVIAANLKGIVVMLGFFIGIFAFLGGIAVVVGLGAAVAVFFGVNLGIGSMGPWIVRRAQMMGAEKKAIEAEAGGRELAGTLKGLDEVGEALRSARKSQGKK